MNKLIILAIVVFVFFYMFSGGKKEKGIPNITLPNVVKNNKLVFGVLFGFAICWFLGRNVEGYENLCESIEIDDNCKHSCEPPTDEECESLIQNSDLRISNFFSKIGSFHGGNPPPADFTPDLLQCNSGSALAQKQAYCMAHTLGSRFGLGGSQQIKDYYNNHISEIYSNSCMTRDQINNYCSSICDSDSENFDSDACNNCSGCSNYTPPETETSSGEGGASGEGGGGGSGGGDEDKGGK